METIQLYVEPANNANGKNGYRLPFVLPRLIDDQAFFEFCQRNANLHIERTAEGETEIMAPAGSETGYYNNELGRQLGNWNIENDEPGYVFDSSAGFTLPNRAVRSPDASWVRRERFDALSAEQRATFAPLCPDFMIELMSPSDSLTDAQAKLEEYIQNGAKLGWLIDRKNQTIYVYRPGQRMQTLVNPASVSAAPELPGFTLSTTRLFR
jgi:Uma2 family endonuclease